MHLSAPTPQAWLDTHLRDFYRYYVEALAEGLEHRSFTVADLLAEDSALIRELHGRMTEEDGTPDPAAGRYLMGSLGGVAATALGYALAASGAVFVPDRDTMRWYLHPEGWTDRFEPGIARALVPSGHPWAGLAGVEVVDSPDERYQRAVAALTDALAPVVDAIAGLAKGGRPGLWAEVADGFASALVYQSRVPVTDEGIAALRGLMSAMAAPWDGTPSIWPVELDFGAVCVMQKLGCCLAYTDMFDEDHEDDQDHRDFHALFPDAPGRPHYCSNCCFRPTEECRDHQLWWRTREHENREAGIPNP